MGIQASTVKITAGKLASEPRKKGTKKWKARIEILAFEVASVMSKSVQLWQSLTDQEMRRFQAQVIKSEGVLNLVSDNESVLLSLACMEKLQDLTMIAMAVSRLGKRCQEPTLIGFEHIYNDILKHTIEVHELEFSYKEMDSRVKKMERYIGMTSSLYQELEILSEMEQAIRRLREEDDPAQKDNLYALEQKVVWQRQEIKYLKEVSLWNRTYDKIVGLLARAVCTVYGKIIKVFGFPIMGWPHILLATRNGEVDHSGSLTSCLSTEEPKLSIDSLNGYTYPVPPGHVRAMGSPEAESHRLPTLNGSASIRTDQNSVMVANGFSRNQNSVTPSSFSSSYQSSESYMPALSLCFSPGRQFGQQRSMSANYASRDSIGSSPLGMPLHENFTTRGSRDASGGLLQPNSGAFGLAVNKGINKFLFDPKTRLQNAPPSTLGGAGLALHYANMVILAEKMARYPQLISQEAREDLYHMLPKNVRVALRSRLRSTTMKLCGGLCYGEGEPDWKEMLERAMGWLAPMAHNMIRWQSEHNFEQQQVVPRTNVLLLQTLYFADRLKAEVAISDLLMGLNILWRHERDSKANSLMEYASNKDYEEYLEWQV